MAMEQEGAAALSEEGFVATAQRFERMLDLRYVGANAELTVPFEKSTDLAAQLQESFSTAHERQYGYRSDEEAVETMNLRLIARGVTRDRHVPDRLSMRSEDRITVAARRAYFGPEIGWVEAPIRGRAQLDGEWRAGPLLIEEFDSTTVVPPDGRARRIAWDTIEIELK